MGKKIYVGNLAFTTTNQELNDHFAQFGAVTSTKVIMDQMTQRSKGFAFIEMEDERDASTAINNLNGKDLNGRALKVNIAKEMERRTTPRY